MTLALYQSAFSTQGKVASREEGRRPQSALNAERTTLVRLAIEKANVGWFVHQGRQ